MQSRVAGAWALIAIGSIVLLHQMNFVVLDTANILALISVTGGTILFTRGWNNPNYKGIFGGTFFVLLGLSLFLMKYNFFPINDAFAIGIIFIDLGIANLVYFAFRKNKISNLITAVVFILIGSLLVAYEYYYISMWEIHDIFSTYWPILIILIGVGLLGEGLLKNFRKNNKEVSKTS